MLLTRSSIRINNLIISNIKIENQRAHFTFNKYVFLFLFSLQSTLTFGNAGIINVGLVNVVFFHRWLKGDRTEEVMF